MKEIGALLDQSGINFSFDDEKQQYYLQDSLILTYDYNNSLSDIFGSIEAYINDINEERRSNDLDLAVFDREKTRVTIQDGKIVVIPAGQNISLFKIAEADGEEHPPRPGTTSYDYIQSVAINLDANKQTDATAITVVPESSKIPC